jgi:hypothetical protein
LPGLACLHDYGLVSRKNCCEPVMGLMMSIRLTCYVRFSVDRRLAFSFYGQDTW